MSRIQDILDKAEREGALHRVGTPAPNAGPGPVAVKPVAYAAAEPVEELADETSGIAAPRVLTGVALDRTLVAALDPGSVAAEQYRALRTRILHADNGSVVNVVMLTSPGRGEGKSVTAANLALTIGQEFQRRVCLVDANFRAPRLHRLFSLPETPGLADVISGRATLDEALVTLEDLNITVLPAGTQPTHPAELLGTSAMRRTLDSLRSHFDRVVIDAPAAAPLADIGILTPLVDGVLVVVRSGITSKPSIHEAVGAVDGGRLLGLVLNDAAA